ncbi:hypothetical protein MLD38_020605 [Melastoma candidum]|uniref:Uncharacterized protein n=1 Tax=Melastoma candidum TaxID=119954 RepID=A0ACB9QFC5_9MYRT|nr:hypothetical protein MLD38_020605 [Melastoma candidum]
MASWKKTISTPFKKAATFFNQQPREKNHPHHHPSGNERSMVMDLQGEVMACAYEDVQVMWSILDKSKSTSSFNLTS